MLILTRKKGESIFVGDEIEVIITEIRRSSVRIGVKAPKGLPVYRKEVHDKILEENQKAAKTRVNTSALDKLNEILNLKLGGGK